MKIRRKGKITKIGRKVKSALTYLDAGVNLDRAGEIKQKIKEIASGTLSHRVLQGVGPFSAVLEVESGRVMLATCDGVGTKTLLSLKYGKVKELGYDLVAMNVNDILAMHGEPEFFLDYIGLNSLDEFDILEFIEGVAEACKVSGCSLVGGETAQMKGFYSKGAVELVGFCIGFANPENLPRIEDVKKGDVVFAFPSSGIHSNGFSLMRKLVEKGLLKMNSNFRGKKLYEIILRPTRIYVRDFFSLVEKVGYPKVSAHITGGGIPENLGRVIPDGFSAFISVKKLQEIQENFADGIFDLISKFVEEDEMRRVFNLGIGFAMVFSSEISDKIRSYSSDLGVFEVGYIDDFAGSKVLFI